MSGAHESYAGGSGGAAPPMMRPSVVAWRLTRFTSRFFIGTVVEMIVGITIIPLTVGVAVRAFFDALSGTSGGWGVWTAIAVFVGVQVAGFLMLPLLRNSWNAMQQKAQVLVARNLIGGIIRGYGRHGLRASVGETLSLMRDDPRVMGDVLDAIADLIARTLFAAIAAVLMWQVDPMITIVLLVPILLSSIIARVLGSRTMAYQAASRRSTARLTGFLGDLIGAQLAVKVAGGTDRAVRRLREMGEERRRMSLRNSVFGEMLNSIHFHLVHVATGAVLLLGARGIRNGTFTVGDFALFVLFLDQLMYLPTEIGRVISDLQRIDVSMSRMQAVIPGESPATIVEAGPVYLKGPLPELPADPPCEPLELLEVRGLSYDHNDDVRGIEDVSFTLERGSFTVITGKIGAGKTTLLHALLGLVQRDRGEIIWNGARVDDPAAFFVPPHSAYTPQVPRLFSESLRENLLLGRADDTRRIDDAIHAAVLEADVDLLEAGLDTLIGPRGVKLSGGQVQRAAAARMFMADAELLVFDDLSSALDTETEAELWSRLFARGDHVTCLVVSHRPAALSRADQILVMDEGRLVDAGTLTELLERSPQMRELWLVGQPLASVPTVP